MNVVILREIDILEEKSEKKIEMEINATLKVEEIKKMILGNVFEEKFELEMRKYYFLIIQEMRKILKNHSQERNCTGVRKVNQQ